MSAVVGGMLCKSDKPYIIIIIVTVAMCNVGIVYVVDVVEHNVLHE